MRKKFFSVLGALILVVSLLLVACAAPAPPPAEEEEEAPPAAPEKEVYNWRLQIVMPMGSTDYKIFTKWSQSIRDMSDGVINIDIYPGGELFPSMEVDMAVATGALDCANTCATYFEGKVPVLGFVLSGLAPYVTRDHVDAYRLVYEYGLIDSVRAGFKKLGELDGGGIHLVDMSFDTVFTFWTKNKMNSAADLKGVKMRLWGGAVAETLAEIGVVPVFIPHAEVPTALATGVIDASGTGDDRYFSQELYRYCPYIYHPMLTGSSSMETIINADLWYGLPDNLKAIINEASNTIRYEWLIWNMAKTAELYSRQKELGFEVVQWSPSDLNVFTEASMKVIAERAKRDAACAEAAAIVQRFMKDSGKL